MDALWFWFAKFLVDLAIGAGILIVFAIILFFLERRK